MEAWEAGQDAAAICQRLGCSRSWFYKWLERYEAGQSDWFTARSRCPHSQPNQTSEEVVEAVKMVRLSLYNKGQFCGAQAIRWELEDMGVDPLPSLRTINRILAHHELTHRRTGRYEPKGRIYPALEITAPNGVHQADFVGPCYLRGAGRFYSYNVVDLATGRCAIQPLQQRGGQAVLDAIWGVWWRLGLPKHQQVDNDLAFYGSPAHPRGMGNLIRLCLALGVEPWFIPPKEPWRNGVVEKFNDHYRQRFLQRCVLADTQDLQQKSRAFEQRHNRTYRYSKLQGRTPEASLGMSQATLRWPPTKAAPRHPLSKPKEGRYHVVRFIRSDRRLDVFGERFTLPVETTYQYVVATIEVAAQKLQVWLGHELIDQLDYKLF